MEGESQMKDLLKKDITIKVVSVLFAILLWLYVLNIDNPYKNRSLTIPLKIENKNTLQEKGLALKNEDFARNVEIIIRGRVEVINKINASDFEAIIDFSKVKSDKDKTLRIDLFYDIDDITLPIIIPRSINIQLEKIEKKSFPIQVEVTGQPKRDYKIIEITQAPENVILEDFQSVIDSVAVVKAVVDVSNLDRDKSVKKECKVYNKEGKEMASLSKNLSVEVKLEVAKEVPITLVVKGKPAEDYIEALRKINPEKALIAGPHEVISGITELKTEPVDIENINQSINVTSLIKLPEGVRLVDTPKEVSVNLAVESLVNKSFVITRDEIGFLGFDADQPLNYEVLTESVEITVKGKQADLQNLGVSSLKPSVNVEGLEEGTHNLPLDISLPPGMKLIENKNVEVKITKAQEQ